MSAGIYQIVNTKTKRTYIGATTRLSKRFYEHRYKLNNGSHSNDRLRSDWMTYGCETFSFEVLEKVKDIKTLRQRENFWILAKQAYNPGFGYNIDLTEKRDEINEKISTAKKGVSHGPHSPQTLAKITAANRARAHLQVGVPLSAETRAKMSATRTGKQHSEKTIKRMSESRSKAWQRIEYREKTISSLRRKS